ncbi:hypothetical protein [Almyronema epifaneia]|uniref:Gas vesicle protein n=1 Tax=Almyronema epifaneia S1 TaxID=2991925 RepID=A0ABW6IG82_9CYAN
MSQQDNFTAGFFTGAFLGGIIGGIVGVVVAGRLQQEEAEMDDLVLSSEADQTLNSASPLTEARIEIARRGLEDKIAQLNEAIDDVRQQLGKVNGHSQPTEDASRVD